jgi:hypothetical protein
MKPNPTDLWGRTIRENLCTLLWNRSLIFAGKILSVNLCTDSHTSAYILFVKKSEQMSIFFDFCELKFNTISIMQRLLSMYFAEINVYIMEVGFYLFFIVIMLLVLLPK